MSARGAERAGRAGGPRVNRTARFQRWEGGSSSAASTRTPSALPVHPRAPSTHTPPPLHPPHTHPRPARFLLTHVHAPPPTPPPPRYPPTHPLPPTPLRSECDLALDVYQQLLSEGCTPNMVTYNVLIDIHAKAGQWARAAEVLDELERQVSQW